MNEDKKKQAFDKAVQQTVDYLYGFHSKKMQSVDDPYYYLQNEIDILQSRLNESRELISLVLSGHRDYAGFTDLKCEEILSTDQATKWDIRWREKQDGKWVTVENVFFGYTVDYELKRKYQQLKKLYPNQDNKQRDEQGNRAPTRRPDKVGSLDWIKRKDGTTEKITFQNHEERNSAIKKRFNELGENNPQWSATVIDGEIAIEFNLSESQVYKIRN